MKVWYSYKYRSYPECPEATCYSKQREDTTARMWMGGAILLLYGIGELIRLCLEYSMLRYWYEVLWPIGVFSTAVYFFFYLIKLRNMTTETEVNILLLKSPFGRNIPEEIYQKAELLRMENTQALFKSTSKFTIIYIGVLVLAFTVIWLLHK